MFDFNLLTATREHSYKLYAKTSRINVRDWLSVWNIQSFLGVQTLTALLY